MLLNVKMPTTVGILTVLSMINTTSESLKEISLHFSAFNFHERLKFDADEHENFFF